MHVIHLMVPAIAGWSRDHLGTSLGFPAAPGLGQCVYVAAASLGLASLSWYALERPANELKRFFPYGSSRVSLKRSPSRYWADLKLRSAEQIASPRELRQIADDISSA
jgi:peptidoglycan/LPS O-acetylase OafA/YrhL